MTARAKAWDVGREEERAAARERRTRLEWDQGCLGCDWAWVDLLRMGEGRRERGGRKGRRGWRGGKVGRRVGREGRGIREQVSGERKGRGREGREGRE